MHKIALKSNISSEAIGAIFIVLFVAVFIVANFVVGFVCPVYILAMVVGVSLAIIFPQSGLLAVVFLTMVFERFFTLQAFWIGKVEYKIYPLDILMVGIFLGLVVQYLLGQKIKFKKIDWLLFSFVILNFIYFVWSVFVARADANLAFSSFKNYAFYSLFYFIALFLIRTQADLQRLFKFFLAGGVAIVGFIIFGLANGEGLWSQYTPLSTEGVRILAFTHSLYIAIALLPTILYTAFAKKCSRALNFLIAIWTVGILGTLMRHLWIAIAVAVAILYVTLPRENKFEFAKFAWRLAVPFLAVLVLVFYAVVMIPQSKLSNSVNNSLEAVSQRAASLASVSADESFAWRGLVWKSAFERFKTNPVLGIGTGQMIYVETEDYKAFIEFRNIHNSYLAILIQLGIVGFGLFFYFVYKNIQYLFRSNGNDAYEYYKFSILSVLGIFLVSIPFQPYLETNLLAIFFWIALGLARALPEINFHPVKYSPKASPQSGI